MGYRDEKETLRARVAELEGDLSDAQETIGRLTGLSPSADTDSAEEPSKILNAPKLIRLERELDFEVSDEGLEAIAEVLRQRLPAGRTPNTWTVTQVGRSLSAPGFSLTQRDGMTQIAVVGDYKGAGLAAVSGGALLGGFLGMATFGIVHDLILQISEAHIFWMAPILMVLVFALLRGRISRSTTARAEKLRGTFEAVVELAKRNRVRDPTRVRVRAAGQEVVEVVVEPRAKTSSVEPG